LRAVLDPNVIISALLSPSGAPARTLRAWQDGQFELVVSQLLLAELERALAYPRLRRRIQPEDAAAVVAWLRSSATVAQDPDEQPPMHSADPGDDYLISLAASERAALVSGDGHLLALTDDFPAFSLARFIDLLETEGR
jgi:uncharacterized protein